MLLRLFGHPVHAMLVSFPIGLLVPVPLWDLLAWSGILPEAAVIARWTELVGLVGGAAAAAIGAYDLYTVARDPGRLTTGLRHAFAAACALALFAVAFAVRGVTPGLGILALDALGAVALLAAGWFGGHLVFHHGTGVAGVPASNDPEG